MKGHKYTAQPGGILSEKKAILVGEFLEYHGKSHTPESVLRLAKPKTSPIHDLFQWDNNSAAHEYRLWQARRLLASVLVVDDHKSVRAYVSPVIVSVEDSPVYYEHQAAMATPSIRRQLFQRYLTELISWKNRASEFEEFSQVFKLIAKLKKEYKREEKENIKNKSRRN